MAICLGAGAARCGLRWTGPRGKRSATACACMQEPPCWSPRSRKPPRSRQACSARRRHAKRALVLSDQTRRRECPRIPRL